jgi:hypothetical protein
MTKAQEASVFSNGKTTESGYPIGDPSRMFLRYIDGGDAPGAAPAADEFRTVAGEGSDQPPATQPPAQPAAAADAPPAPAAPPADPKPADTPTPPADAPTKPWGDDKDFNPEKAWNLIENLKKDKAGKEKAVADARAEATTQAQKDLVEKLARELGVIEDPKDPADLLNSVTAQKDGLSKENRLLKVENTVIRSASTLGADLEAVLDSRELERKFLEIDPSADDYTAQVAGIVKEAVEKNPARYRKAQVAPGASGGDFTSGNGSGPKDPAPADDDIEEARKKAAARKEGRA